MAKIAIDCDGVLADFTRAFYEAGNKIWPGRLDESYQPNDWNDFQGLSNVEVEQVWKRIRATPNWWLYLSPYSGNVGALATFLLTKAGHDVWIVTSRVPSVGMTVAKQTALWLASCGVFEHHNHLGVITVEHWHDKAKIYKATQMEFSMDDKAETVMACDKLEDHKAYLLDRSWNQHVTPKRRVSSLQSLLQDVPPSDPK